MLTIDRVTHIYPNGVEALRDVSLRVQSGELVAIVGPSGCGKSTLLRIAAGLHTCSSGHILLDGQRITGPSDRVSLMFQDAALLPWRSVRRNIALPLELRGLTESKRVADLIETVGLQGFADAPPRELSGGMAQRVALARALVTQPPILLLDEPFGALDAMTRETLTLALAEICRSAGTTALFVTHSISEAVFLADRIVVLTPRPGRVAAIIPVNLPRPRNWNIERTPEFGEVVGQVRDELQAISPATATS